MRYVALIVSFLFIHIISVNSQSIRINQIGYYPSAQKIAAVPGSESGSFEIINTVTNQTVYTGNLPSNSQKWESSGEEIKFADFSEFTEEGSYIIKTANENSHQFDIKSNKLYDEMSKWVAKGFYLWRASTPIESQYATFKTIDYSREAGHPDDKVLIHASAATEARPEGTIVSAPGGWYDAGDYNLYVVNAGVSLFMMAHAYELYPEYFASQNLNIPESNNLTPDLLDEIKWELDWLLAMQDLDGGVYFKLTSERFNGYEMPSEDNMTRYMVGKSTTSALNFAAMTAMAYRLFKNSADYPELSEKCLQASEKAWLWAKANPSIRFTNPSGISTGGYGDSNFSDEFFWAAAELFISTGKQSYYNELNFNVKFSPPLWHSVSGNGIMSLALHLNELPEFADENLILEKFTALADDIYNTYNQSVYKIPMERFQWGSNGDMAARASVLGTAFEITGDEKYRVASLEGLNYLLGRTPTGYCFVSGFGEKHPVDLHDRRSQADGIENSLPGYLAGGPNTDARNDCGISNYPSSNIAKSYLDKECSYSTNEIALNWNAPMLALLAITQVQNDIIKDVEQHIELESGWNLISTNVHPADSSISSVFNELDVQTIKTLSDFWDKDQEETFNSLQSISAGKGYLIFMNSAGKLSLTGKAMTEQLFATEQAEWQLIGCPYQIPTPFSKYFSSSNSSLIKSFTGTWQPGSNTNSIENFEPGKAYFLRK